MDILQLEKTLKDKNVSFELVHTERTILTVEDSKKYFPQQALSLTLILKTDKEFLALLPAAARGKVDFKQMKKLLQCKNLSLATSEEVKEQTGYSIGAVPLWGHGLPIVFDKELLSKEFIYGGSGDKNYTLKIKPDDLLRISDVCLIYE